MKKAETPILQGFQPNNDNVRERIRTPDTLVRSQVLYPAELHTRMILRRHFSAED